MGRELDYFRQASQPQNEVLAELSPGKADAFFKMIFILANVIDYIKIQGSKLYQRMKNLPNVLFYADFTALVGENVNLHFQTSKMDLSKLRKLRRNKHVIILDGQIQQAYQHMQISTCQSKPKFKLSELGNAERLISRFGDDLLFCPQKKTWYTWTGRRWKEDESGKIHNYAKKTIREIYQEAVLVTKTETKKKLFGHALKSESAFGIKI